jgi:hypothetical protein
VLIDEKFSIYHPYIMENFPSAVILQHKTWKNSLWLLHLLLNIMEDKPKFKPNPNLRLMDQVRQVMKGAHLLMAKVLIEDGVNIRVV